MLRKCSSSSARTSGQAGSSIAISMVQGRFYLEAGCRTPGRHRVPQRKRLNGTRPEGIFRGKSSRPGGRWRFCKENRDGPGDRRSFSAKSAKGQAAHRHFLGKMQNGRVANASFSLRNGDGKATFRHFLGKMRAGRPAHRNFPRKMAIGRLTFSIFHEK